MAKVYHYKNIVDYTSYHFTDNDINKKTGELALQANVTPAFVSKFRNKLLTKIDVHTNGIG